MVVAHHHRDLPGQDRNADANRCLADLAIRAPHLPPTVSALVDPGMVKLLQADTPPYRHSSRARYMGVTIRSISSPSDH